MISPLLTLLLVNKPISWPLILCPVLWPWPYQWFLLDTLLSASPPLCTSLESRVTTATISSSCSHYIMVVE